MSADPIETAWKIHAALVDWTGKVGAAVDVKPFWDALSAQARDSMAYELPGDREGGAPLAASDEDQPSTLDEEQSLLISLAELITFMALAATRAMSPCSNCGMPQQEG